MAMGRKRRAGARSTARNTKRRERSDAPQTPPRECQTRGGRRVKTRQNERGDARRNVPSRSTCKHMSECTIQHMHQDRPQRSTGGWAGARGSTTSIKFDREPRRKYVSTPTGKTCVLPVAWLAQLAHLHGVCQAVVSNSMQ